jgi:signal recognition particle subunit SRP54
LPGDLFKGMPKLTPDMTAQMEKEMKRTQAIIDSMTPGERGDHTLINSSRRKRIAKGSGTTVQQVNAMLTQYVEMKQMMNAMMGSGMMGGLGGRVARKLTGMGSHRKKKKKKKR